MYVCMYYYVFIYVCIYVFNKNCWDRWITLHLYTNEGDLVYDPFSGRGTTTLEAIKLNRKIISNDLSPLAYVLTKSKTFPINVEDAIKYVNKLKKDYIKSNWEIPINSDKYKDIKVFYSLNNLKQLDYLREKIGKNWRRKNFSKMNNYILAIALGIMHGPVRKSGDENNSIYFSVNMPSGYSMSPNYAEKYIKKNELFKIENDIFDQIIYRIKNKRNDFLPSNDENNVYNGDALKSSQYFKNNKPKLIFTSPPYLNLIKYVEQNWMRFWLLNFDKKQTKEKMVDDYHKLEEYKDFISNFLIEMEKIMDNESRLIMVIGDVKKYFIRSIMNEIIEKISCKTNLYLEEEPIKQVLKNKLSRQMGKRVGKATESDWVFIFRRKNEGIKAKRFIYR